MQVYEGGEVGEVYTTSLDELTLGRTGGDKQFPDDEHMSHEHARISRDDGGFTLEDLGSTNGTYIKLREATRLEHGDCLLLGQQLLRVDFS
jgi:predicted component of type VI protein secretion system